MKRLMPAFGLLGWFFIVSTYQPLNVLHTEKVGDFVLKLDCQKLQDLIQLNNPNYDAMCKQDGVTLNPNCPFIVYGCFKSTN